MDETNTPMATPYNYAVAQRLLGQRDALAQALLSTQMPAAGQVVPGSTSKASGGGWYVPNTAGAASSALQRVLGAFLMNKNNQAYSQDIQNQNNAVQSALDQLSPTPVTQSVSNPNTPQEQSNLNAANAPSANAPGLSGVDVSNVPKEQLAFAAPSQQQQSQGMLDLLQAGPMGQAVAQRAFAAPKFFQNPNTGAITGVNPYTGEQVSQVGQSGGVNPKMAPTLWNAFSSLDFSKGDPAIVAQGNSILQQLGMGGNYNGQQLTQMQSVARSNIQRNSALANNSNANASFTAGPRTQQAYAAAEKDLEATAAQRQSTGLAGAGAVETANNSVANLNFQLGRTQDAINISKGFADGSLTGGKIFTTIGEAQNWLGRNPQFSAYRDYLTTANMQQIVAALQHQGRITGNEVQTFSNELLNGSMPFQTVQYLLGQQAALLGTQKMNADINARNVGGAVGAANPGMNTNPVQPGPVPQISQAPVRVRAPNGSIGTVPASQLQAALSHGYTQVQ